MPRADVDIHMKAETHQAVGKLKDVSKELKAAANGGDAISRAAPAKTAHANPAKSTASTIGMALGKAAVAYIAHEGVSTLASVVGNSQGGSRTANRISSIGGGAIAGGMTGAVVGSIIPVVGTVIGAAVGTIAGAVTGFVKTMGEEARNFRESMNAISSAHLSVANTQTIGMRDRAFDRLQSVKQRPQQIDDLGERLKTLRFGDGTNSIRNLQSRILAAEKTGKTDNVDYLSDKDLFARQKGREAAMMRQLEDLRVPTLGSMLRSGEVGDTLSVMGGTVGAQVDVVDVNQRQLEVLKQILDTLSYDGRISADAATPRSTIISYQ